MRLVQSPQLVRAALGEYETGAVANGHAAYLRRDGKVERVELINVDTGGVTLLARRMGKAAWGRGQIVAGRPLDYDGARVVFSSGRQVLALSPKQ